MIRMLGGLVGRQAEAITLADRLSADPGFDSGVGHPFPGLRTFFEEWDDPLISGIRWVEELWRSPAGTPIFPELADARLRS